MRGSSWSIKLKVKSDVQSLHSNLSYRKEEGLGSFEERGYCYGSTRGAKIGWIKVVLISSFKKPQNINAVSRNLQKWLVFLGLVQPPIDLSWLRWHFLHSWIKSHEITFYYLLNSHLHECYKYVLDPAL